MEEEASSLALQVKGMQLKHEKQLKTDNCKQGKKIKTIIKKVEELKKIRAIIVMRLVTGIESVRSVLRIVKIMKRRMKQK